MSDPTPPVPPGAPVKHFEVTVRVNVDAPTEDEARTQVLAALTLFDTYVECIDPYTPDDEGTPT